MHNEPAKDKITEAKQHLDQNASGVKSFVVATIEQGGQVTVHHEGSEEDMHKLVAQISQEMGKAKSGDVNAAPGAVGQAQPQSIFGVQQPSTGVGAAHPGHEAAPHTATSTGAFSTGNAGHTASTGADAAHKKEDESEKDKEAAKKKNDKGVSSAKVDFDDKNAPKKISN